MRYHMHPGCHAQHGQSPAPPASVIAHLVAENIWICQGPPPEEPSITPVYMLASEAPAASSPSGRGVPAAQGALAVPTGAIFIRFKEGTLAESRRAEIEQAGYTLTNIPPYAPHAAWVQSADGGIAAALNGASKLLDLQDVENVEPQMLQERRGK